MKNSTILNLLDAKLIRRLIGQIQQVLNAFKTPILNLNRM